MRPAKNDARLVSKAIGRSRRGLYFFSGVDRGALGNRTNRVSRGRLARDAQSVPCRNVEKSGGKSFSSILGALPGISSQIRRVRLSDSNFRSEDPLTECRQRQSQEQVGAQAEPCCELLRDLLADLALAVQEVGYPTLRGAVHKIVLFEPMLLH